MVVITRLSVVINLGKNRGGQIMVVITRLLVFKTLRKNDGDS